MKNFLAFAFAVIMLGMHKPQQQATITKKKHKIPVILFRFRFVIRQSETPKSPDFFAHNRLCEEGTNQLDSPPQTLLDSLVRSVPLALKTRNSWNKESWPLLTWIWLVSQCVLWKGAFGVLPIVVTKSQTLVGRRAISILASSRAKAPEWVTLSSFSLVFSKPPRTFKPQKHQGFSLSLRAHKNPEK